MTETPDPFAQAAAEVTRYREAQRQKAELMQRRSGQFQNSWCQTITGIINEVNPGLNSIGVQFRIANAPQGLKNPSYCMGLLAHDASGERIALPTLTFSLKDADIVSVTMPSGKFERLLGISDAIPVQTIRQAMADYLVLALKTIPG